MDAEHLPGKLVVVGGGLAGCSAALALARSGHSVTLVESKSRLGGRASSYTDQETGLSIDYCQHVGMGCCSHLIQWIDMLGQKALWLRQPVLHFYGPDGRVQTLRSLPCVPAPLHLASWLLRWPGLNWSDRVRIAWAMNALNRIQLSKESVNLDGVSALEWLQSQGQSRQSLEHFWGTILVSALGESLDRVGLLSMVKVLQDGFLRKRDAFHLLIPQRPLDELFGSRVHSTLIEGGVDVVLSAGSTRLDWKENRCVAVHLADGRRIAGDKFILAVPWHGLSALLGDCPIERLTHVATDAGQLNASPISGVHTWWDRAWLPTPHAVIVGRLCQWVFSHADPNSLAKEAHYYQVVISASRSLPKGDVQAVRRLIESDLKAVFPAARAAQLLRIRSVTDPQAVFSVAPNTELLRPPLGNMYSNISLAGDWMRTGWPATMESALLSGFAAAKYVTLPLGGSAR